MHPLAEDGGFKLLVHVYQIQIGLLFLQSNRPEKVFSLLRPRLDTANKRFQSAKNLVSEKHGKISWHQQIQSRYPLFNRLYLMSIFVHGFAYVHCQKHWSYRDPQLWPNHMTPGAYPITTQLTLQDTLPTYRLPNPNAAVMGSNTSGSIFPSFRKRSGLNTSGWG